MSRHAVSSPIRKMITGGYVIVGGRRADGATIMHPASSTEIGVGGRVVILGYHDDIPELGTRHPRRSAPRVMTSRGARIEI